MTVAPTLHGEVALDPDVDVVAAATQSPQTPTPTLTPSPTLSPTPTATPLIKGIYEVVPGDTLIGIALEHDVTVEELLAVNALLDPDLLRVGQELRIPGAVVRDVDFAPDPDTPDTLYVCPDTGRVYTLNLPGEAIQLRVLGDSLYLVAGGRLYRLLLEELGRTPVVTPTDVMPPDNRVADIAIQELVYMAHDTATDDLYLLDKSTDIYRYDREGRWHLVAKARQLPGVFPDPQYLALAVHDGVIYILDADLARVWRIDGDGDLPEPHFLGSEVGTGVDFAMPEDAAGDRFFVISRDGSLAVLEVLPGPDGVGRPDVPSLAWPAQVQTVGDYLVMVDGEARSVTVREQAGYAPVRTLLFRFPGMPRLRQAALVGGTVTAIGGPYLYAASFAGLTSTCPQVTFDNRMTFRGVDVRELLPQVAYPFADGVMPSRPRSYPGARRLYRRGVHEGLDIYSLDVPYMAVGTPFGAIADGTVTRADHDYVEMTPVEYDAAEAQTRADHFTNEELSDDFLGRQVRLDHSETVTSIYAHLDDIAPAVTPGRNVLMRATLGTVGVSGTQSGAYGITDGYHLHFEIWVDEYYLGEGLSIYETMRIWEALFEGTTAD